MSEDMRDMLEAMTRAQVEFLVVGAFAMAVHGVPRATGDIDLWVKADSANAERVMRALRDFGAPIEQHAITVADFTTAGLVYQIGLPPNRIDLLTQIDGVTFNAAWSRRASGSLFGVAVPVLGLDDLVANKRASGRPKDRVDVQLLEGGTD